MHILQFLIVFFIFIQTTRTAQLTMARLNMLLQKFPISSHRSSHAYKTEFCITPVLPSSGCSQHGVICGECRETRYNKYLLISIMCTWNRAVFSLKIWRECRMNYKYYSLQMNNIWILIQNIIIMHLYLSFTSQLLFIQLAEVQSKGSVYFKDALKCCVPIFSVAFLLLLNRKNQLQFH